MLSRTICFNVFAQEELSHCRTWPHIKLQWLMHGLFLWESTRCTSLRPLPEESSSASSSTSWKVPVRHWLQRFWSSILWNHEVMLLDYFIFWAELFKLLHFLVVAYGVFCMEKTGPIKSLQVWYSENIFLNKRNNNCLYFQDIKWTQNLRRLMKKYYIIIVILKLSNFPMD